jgi:prevent-host-death family protein
MDVGIRELKAKLSAYIARAAAGEHLTVTDRGKPVAILGPPIGRVDLAVAEEAGWLTRASGPGLKPVRRHPPISSVTEVLAEDRGE